MVTCCLVVSKGVRVCLLPVACNHQVLTITFLRVPTQAMLSKLKGVSDPEAKRKAIGGEFIKVFQDFRDGLEKSINKCPKFLVQGTL